MVSLHVHIRVWLVLLFVSTTSIALAQEAEPEMALAPPIVWPSTSAGTAGAWLEGLLNGAQVRDDAFEHAFNEEFLAVVGDGFRPSFEGLASAGPYALVEVTEAAEDGHELQVLVQDVSGEYWRLYVHTDLEDRMDGVRLQLAGWLSPSLPGSWDAVVSQLEAEASHIGLLAVEVLPNGELAPVMAVGADEVFGTASSFKLYVLAAMAQAVVDGTHSWDDPLALENGWKTLGGGPLTYVPEGTEHTLLEYAELMISVSENTATDALMFLLGREACEAMLGPLGHHDPSLMRPMLLLHEFMSLKVAVTDEERAVFLAGNEDERRAWLDARPHLSLLAIQLFANRWTGPRFIDTVEWLATPSDMIRALVGLRELSKEPGAAPVMDILSMNPGTPMDPTVWQWVGYKGGSESGVMAFNWLLRRSDGRWFGLSVLANDPDHAVDLDALLQAASGASNLLGLAP